MLCGIQHATTTDGALEMYPGAGVANIGIMLFRSSAKIFAEVLHTLLCVTMHPSHAKVHEMVCTCVTQQVWCLGTSHCLAASMLEIKQCHRVLFIKLW